MSLGPRLDIVLLKWPHFERELKQLVEISRGNGGLQTKTGCSTVSTITVLFLRQVWDNRALLLVEAGPAWVRRLESRACLSNLD